jgi:hypothetical protein
MEQKKSLKQASGGSGSEVCGKTRKEPRPKAVVYLRENAAGFKLWLFLISTKLHQRRNIQEQRLHIKLFFQLLSNRFHPGLFRMVMPQI